MKEITFEVVACRRMPEPAEGVKRYFALCEIHRLPDNFSMKPNPRERRYNGKVVNAIKDSLKTDDS